MIADIHGALQAIGYALLVLFFVVGVVKTCGSFVEVKKPEHALKLFVRFVLAKALITYGMELMLALLDIIQGVVSSIMNAAGFGAPSSTVLPAEIVTAVEDCGFFESIPLWAVTLIGGLLIWVLSFVMILSVYGRFSKFSVRPEVLWHKPKQHTGKWEFRRWHGGRKRQSRKAGEKKPIISQLIRRGNPTGSVACWQRRKLGSYLTTTARQDETM